MMGDDPLTNRDDPLADPAVWTAVAGPTGEYAPGDPPQYIGPRRAGRRSGGCGCQQTKKLVVVGAGVVGAGLAVGALVRFLGRRR